MSMTIEVLVDEREDRRYRLERDGDLVSVRRDGEDGSAGDELVLDWRRPEPGVYSLIVDGDSYEVFVDDHGDELDVHLLNRTFRVRAADARRLQRVVAAEAADGVARITAPIPGRVVELLCDEGSEVDKGEGIVVLEAMKMENELRAPRAGTVTKFHVEEGQGVEGGALLVTIE